MKKRVIIVALMITMSLAFVANFVSLVLNFFSLFTEVLLIVPSLLYEVCNSFFY